MPTKEQLSTALRQAHEAGDTQAARQLANAIKGGQFDDVSRGTGLGRAADVGLAAISGGNILAPSLLGMPVDLATNIRNLGIAGYGAARGLLTGDPASSPRTIDPASQVGGSAWMKRKMSGLLGSDVFSVPDPTDPLQQKAQLAGSILTAGAVSPATGVKQMAGNIGKMAPPAAGSVAMQTAFPDQPLAPAIGMMTVPLASQTIKAIPPIKAPIKLTAAKANQLGYKLLPKSAKEGMGQDMVQGAAGPVPLKQLASAHNQKITNSIVKRDLGIPDEVPITADALANVRADAGAVYSKVQGLGKLRVDAQYVNGLKALKRPGAMAKDFPDAGKPALVQEVNKYDSRNITTEGAVAALKQLRRDADAGFNSLDPATKDLARIQGKIANNLESLLARQIKKTNPELYTEFVTARKTIAKTYQVQKALTQGDNVDAIALGRQLTKGKPITGGLRDVAELGKNFKEVAQANPPQVSNFRPMDLAAGVLGTAVDPTLATALFARPALRKILLSDAYQARLTRMPKGALTSGQIRKVLSRPEGAQATALIVLLNKAIGQDSASQLDSPLPQTQQ